MSSMAGGTLVASETDDNGVATRVYGISQCGTVFMVEPNRTRSVILHHLACHNDANEKQCTHKVPPNFVL